MEVTFPEVDESTDVMELWIFRLSAGHFLRLDVGYHVHGVVELASSFGHVDLEARSFLPASRRCH